MHLLLWAILVAMIAGIVAAAEPYGGHPKMMKSAAGLAPFEYQPANAPFYSFAERRKGDQIEMMQKPLAMCFDADDGLYVADRFDSPIDLEIVLCHAI